MAQATTHQNSDDDLRLLREPAVLALFPMSRSKLWAQVKEGLFPAPVKLSARCTAWRFVDLKRYAENLTTAQGGSQ